jgi:hypothetical protein
MWADIERSIAKLSDILYKPRVVTNRLFPDISLVQNVCITIKYIDHCACHNYFHVGNIMICHRDTKLFWFQKFTVKVKIIDNFVLSWGVTRNLHIAVKLDLNFDELTYVDSVWNSMQDYLNDNHNVFSIT